MNSTNNLDQANATNPAGVSPATPKAHQKADGKGQTLPANTRKIEKYSSETGKSYYVAIICYCQEWEEYIVRFFSNGLFNPRADYHTDDLDDAQGTVHSWMSERTEAYSKH